MTTETDEWEPPDPDELAGAAAIVASARKIVALTGAGISTDAGIADFRGPNGLWTKNPDAEKLSTLDNYLADGALRRRGWIARLDSPVWRAQPTRAHLALVELESRGALHTLVTQNTDGLHHLAGNSPGLVVEIHGTTHWTVCWTCGDRQPTLTVLERVRQGDEDPRCQRPVHDGPECGGILKTATVSFGQSLNPEDLERAYMAAIDADVMLAVGTTLEVQPIAGIVPQALRAGASIVIVNGSATAYDSIADAVVRGPISEVLPAIVGAVPSSESSG